MDNNLLGVIDGQRKTDEYEFERRKDTLLYSTTSILLFIDSILLHDLLLIMTQTKSNQISYEKKLSTNLNT